MTSGQKNHQDCRVCASLKVSETDTSSGIIVGIKEYQQACRVMRETQYGQGNISIQG